MENEAEVFEIKPKNMFVPICIVQAVCIAVILITVIIIKFFWNESFIKLQKWCQNSVFEQTEITANFDEETKNEV